MRPSKKKGSKVKAKPLPLEVTKEEFRRIQETIRDNLKKRKYFMANLLAWGSGMRISEVVNLKPEDFNFIDKSIRINEGKNSKDRIVPIPKGWKEVHMKYIPIGVGQRSIQKEFEKACIECGLKDKKPTVHFHSLRHGFATECLRSRIDIAIISGLLGHSDISTTSIYINLVPKERIEKYQEKFLSRE